MKRFIVGALAVIGALSILFVAGLILLILVASASKPSVPGTLVLELELDQPLQEQVPEDSLAGAFGPEPTTVRDVVEALEKAAQDSRVKSLLVRIDQPGGIAVAQELRDAVKAFRASGKKAVAYTDTFGEGGSATGAYYLATAFDEVYVQPSGDVTLTGVAMETPFARDAFAKLGVQPRIGQRYEYKNAVNTYTEQGYTAAHREATEKFLGSLFGQVVRGIAEGRKLSEDEVKALIDRAPLLGQAALEAKLVDGLLYRDEVLAKVKAEAGEGAKLLFLDKYLERAGRPHETGETVALVYGVGGIVRGKSGFDPLGGDASFGADSVALALRKATEDKDVKAILFRVDSPGGSYVASDTVRREVQRAREQGKPVIVSMATYAASGGYFVSMGADKIVAQPGTLTGSIGVYGGKMVTADFWAKLGINFETVAFGKDATLYSTDTDFSPEQLAKNEASLDRVYVDFTQKAAEGRRLPLEKLQAVARGRVWTGEDAKELGLVDELGGFPKALELVREAAKLPKDAKVRLQVFPRKKQPAEVIAGLLGGGEGDNSEDERSAQLAALSPWVPALEQTRQLYRLGTRLGLWGPQPETLRAPLPETRW
ncbi:signal peptide peptidase A. Serine peptidase. MEROPS family S49 [Stigmatella aurantiaca]|uniref:Signal peptide peptidase A. Serine peptidase. MEROPS family S49 n=1 Tax=Stigmatella aurantiaca TaxID=41 RepID=A0A1H7LYK4_STIAU|nr:signal peptide peptidase SppA [Stigmatella aurantiaca]SEL04014.1 signal peptide peptidase A. Serine peptidase. MEROPS family S49 [Stigmatella aurantiaca]